MQIKIKKIIRSTRKSIMLQVCDDATLVVKAPFKVSEDIIEKAVLKHKKWLENKKKEILSRDMSFTQKKFVNGERFLYLGDLYHLKFIRSPQLANSLFIQDECFYMQEGIVNPREFFVTWYKQAAYKKIYQRVVWYAQKRGFKYNQIRISNAQKRWGSCSYLGNLNFSWRLVMATLPVIDYVVIHELVHLIEKNHSKAFWNKVCLLMPEYKKHKNWLKKNGYLLTL